MNVWLSLIAFIFLVLLVIVGVSSVGLYSLFGYIIPYTALAVFIIGFIYRVISWARSPVPFRIPTTSLFRNTKSELRDGPRIVYGASKWLWAAGLAFHWSFLIILIRHMRFFIEPVPAILTLAESLDGFFQVGLPIILATDIIIILAVSYLFLRRIFDSKLRYISLPADYFPLLLILGIASTGILMRYFTKTDLVGIKQLAIGLVSFSPVVPEGIGLMFYIHLFLVSILLTYFPFSKLMHLGGVFLSPTRNLANTNREKRHVNPWDYPVKVHTYEEYEDEFRDVMKACGLPLEKES